MSLDFHQKIEAYKKEMMRQYQKSQKQNSYAAETSGQQEDLPVNVRKEMPETPSTSEGVSLRENTDRQERERQDGHEIEPSVKRYHPKNERTQTMQTVARPENKESFSKIEPLAYQGEQVEQAMAAAHSDEKKVQGRSEASQSVAALSEQETPQNAQEDAASSVETTGNEALDRYLQKYPNRGFLKMETNTAQDALPVKGAVGIVSKVIEGTKYNIDRLITDESGRSETIALPAPDKNLSERPQAEGEDAPFATYDLEITREGFVPVVAKDIPIFDGVLSVQPVTMQPLLNSEGNARPNEIAETEPNL